MEDRATAPTPTPDEVLAAAHEANVATIRSSGKNSVFCFSLLNEPHPTEFFSSFCFGKLSCIAKEGLGVVEWLGKSLETLFGSGLCSAVASKKHIFAHKMASTTAGAKLPPPLNQAHST